MSDSYVDHNRIHQEALIGKFVISFEHIVTRIRLIILKICFPNCTSEQRNNCEILLEGTTADLLKKKLKALVVDNFVENEKLQKSCKLMVNIFDELIKTRNEIVHGNIFLGWATPYIGGGANPKTLSLKKTKINKSGLDSNSIIIHNKTLEKITQQCSALGDCFSLLDTIIFEEGKGKEIEYNEDRFQKIENLINGIGKIELKPEYKVPK